MLQFATKLYCFLFLLLFSSGYSLVAKAKYALHFATFGGIFIHNHEHQKTTKMSQPISIQKKITLGFSALLVLISLTAVAFYFLVQQVEEKLYLVEVVEDFLSITLELRRYEKNYFLYRLDADYQDNLVYQDKLLKTVKDNTEIFASLDTTVVAEQVDRIIHQYRDKMYTLYSLNNGPKNRNNTERRESLQNVIRDIGQQLTLYAEDITAREKTLIQRILKTSKTILLSSTLAFVILSFILIALLRQKFIASLNMLKEYTKQVAHGEMVDPPVKKVEEEIQTIFQAFARMNNELRLRQRQMVQSEKLASLGTLLAGVAHELNNPLSNISTSAQILAEEEENPDKDFHKTLVKQIEEQTDKARDIVRTLLEFSRTKEFRKEELNLMVLINSALRLLRTDISSEIEVIMDIPDELIVNIDKQRMQQVFLNLIKNAADACDGKGKIWITAKEYITNGHDEVEILVSDNGSGIPSETLEKIFDPFYTSKDVGKGSGLGLFIVHDIIESHGGSIIVDSRANEGTTFIIWLPGGADTP